MNIREVATEYRMASWAQAVQERTANGQSIKAFCRDRGISQNTYYYWQRKLREAACEGLASVSEAAAEQSLVPAGWAMCKPAETVPAKAVVIEINGIRVQVESDTDPELLAKTCRMLKSLC